MAPLSDKLENLSMVIPTKNRSFFLYKLLKYHSRVGFAGTIMVGDASESPELERNQEVVEQFGRNLKIIYDRHAPSTSLVEGTNLLLDKASTPYSVLSGDDDFLIAKTLANCVAFLETHPDYSCACGQQAYVYVERQADHIYEVQKVEAGYSKNQEDPSPSKRMVQYCMPARGNNTFSIQRLKSMRYCWETASSLGLDKTKYHSPIHEVSINIMSLIQGKQIKFPNLYHAMLRHQERVGGNRSSFQGDVSWLRRMSAWNWSDEVLKLVDWWAAELSKREGLDFKKAKDISEAVFLQCWIPVMISWRDNLLKVNDCQPKFDKNSKEHILQWLKKTAWIRRLWDKIRSGQKISLTQFMDQNSIYYNDFQPIHAILSQPIVIN